MKFFSTLKNQATSFLNQYKTGNPATYAAAEQAIGAILITDGLIGIDNPFGEKKRPGIFGTVLMMGIGIIFMFIPTIFGNLTNLKNMTATTPATVVSVGSSSTDSNACPMTVQYSVDGKSYTKQSAMSSSTYCSLSQGDSITIDYDPANPGSWIYGSKTISKFLMIFFFVGLLVLVSGILTFVIRLLSIIFGWKLLADGRKNAAGLPQGTNLQTMIDEIKQNFTKSVFNFGGVSNIVPPAAQPSTPAQPPATPAENPPAPEPPQSGPNQTMQK